MIESSRWDFNVPNDWSDWEPVRPELAIELAETLGHRSVSEFFSDMFEGNAKYGFVKFRFRPNPHEFAKWICRNAKAYKIPETFMRNIVGKLKQ